MAREVILQTYKALVSSLVVPGTYLYFHTPAKASQPSRSPTRVADRMASNVRSMFYLLLVPMFLMVCAGLTLGLTFAPCYSSLCVEQMNSQQTRIHVGVYYALLLTTSIALAAKAYCKPVHRWLETFISDRRLPFTDKRLSFGGLLLLLWISTATFASIGYWLPAQYRWWHARGALVDWTPSSLSRVVWTGITGHWCDIWIGLVIIPVGRNTIMGRVFHVHTSSLLFAHKLLAYALLVGTLVHGVTYYAFVASLISASATAQSGFVVDNPTVSMAQSATKGALSNLVLPTGVFSFVLIVVVAVTSLPLVRRKNFNMFYFIHVIFAALILILACLHASTNFYFLLPGLLLWVSDWVWRLRCSLLVRNEAIVENAGNGWTRVTLPSHQPLTPNDAEKHETSSSSTYSPTLATYYVNFPTLSKMELHPFTAASPGSAEVGPVLLFRRGPERKKSRQTKREFTWAVAAAAETSAGPSKLQVRIEGPYPTPVPETGRANHLLLIVGGTGITGAMAISNWWADNYGSRTDQTRSLRLVWSIRSEEMARLREVEDLQIIMAAHRNMEFVVHISGQEGRLEPEKELAGFMALRDGMPGSSAWVYVSGPSGLLTDAETACVQEATRLRRASHDGSAGTCVTTLEWYIARWSL